MMTIGFTKQSLSDETIRNGSFGVSTKTQKGPGDAGCHENFGITIQWRGEEAVLDNAVSAPTKREIYCPGYNILPFLKTMIWGVWQGGNK
mmetsp:Transcript_11520/g.33935  ORF Transcript_11520/g.33935 Transcript_11520/m.33935 type:complete len:90 (-) Transcript_11520:174-443(-)